MGYGQEEILIFCKNCLQLCVAASFLLLLSSGQNSGPFCVRKSPAVLDLNSSLICSLPQRPQRRAVGSKCGPVFHSFPLARWLSPLVCQDGKGTSVPQSSGCCRSTLLVVAGSLACALQMAALQCCLLAGAFLNGLHVPHQGLFRLPSLPWGPLAH